jgi:hypothetical protein
VQLGSKVFAVKAIFLTFAEITGLRPDRHHGQDGQTYLKLPLSNKSNHEEIVFYRNSRPLLPPHGTGRRHIRVINRRQRQGSRHT